MNNNIALNESKYLSINKMEIIEQEVQEKRNISVSLRAKEREKDSNISLEALIELKNVGFNTEYAGTLFLANIIEDLYYERVMFDGSIYFDLSRFDNDHYKYVFDRYQVNDIDFYRGEIAKSIATSKYESKNINDIAYTVVDKIIKRKKSLILEK